MQMHMYKYMYMSMHMCVHVCMHMGALRDEVDELGED